MLSWHRDEIVGVLRNRGAHAQNPPQLCTSNVAGGAGVRSPVNYWAPHASSSMLTSGAWACANCWSFPARPVRAADVARVSCGFHTNAINGAVPCKQQGTNGQKWSGGWAGWWQVSNVRSPWLGRGRKAERGEKETGRKCCRHKRGLSGMREEERGRQQTHKEGGKIPRRCLCNRCCKRQWSMALHRSTHRRGLPWESCTCQLNPRGRSLQQGEAQASRLRCNSSRAGGSVLIARRARTCHRQSGRAGRCAGSATCITESKASADW